MKNTTMTAVCFIGEWTELYLLSPWKLQWGTVSFDGLVQYPETNASWFVNISAMFWDIWKKRLPWRKTRFLFDPKERHASTWGTPDRLPDTGLTRLLGDPHSGFLWTYSIHGWYIYDYLPTFSGSIASMGLGYLPTFCHKDPSFISIKNWMGPC